MISLASLAILKTIPWRRVLPVIFAAAVVLFCWWRVDAHFDHVADLETKVTKQAGVIEDRDAQIARMVTEQAESNKATEEAERAYDIMDQAYQDLVANPPEAVTRWRERIVTIPAEIVAPTCEGALLQAHQIIVDTAGWPGGDP